MQLKPYLMWHYRIVIYGWIHKYECMTLFPLIVIVPNIVTMSHSYSHYCSCTKAVIHISRINCQKRLPVEMWGVPKWNLVTNVFSIFEEAPTQEGMLNGHQTSLFSIGPSPIFNKLSRKFVDSSMAAGCWVAPRWEE